ncbi:MAG TPA: alpha/beta fold hydrolase [Gemmatimonadaceae bacterium]|nr:alpha/beta fold hydrolase [Gemmatimonadaceae bacterium]
METRARLLEGLPVSESTLQLAGISTAVLQGGEGPPVILLHGPGEYAAKWLRVIPELVKTHRVIAPDLPGHGVSAVAATGLDVERAMLWLSELIDATCDDPPILVGQILGGAIAARFACSHGDRISTLVLVDALGLSEFEPDPAFGQALMAFSEAPSEQTHDHLWSKCAFDLARLQRRMGDDWERVKAYNLDRAADATLGPAQHALMGSFGLPAIPEEQLLQISVPTSLIWGRHDLATSLVVAERAAERYGWALQVIENAADDPPMEQPEAFTDALRTAIGEKQESHVAPKEAWDAIASGYDQFVAPGEAEFANAALEFAQLKSGDRFLDVAAGTGGLSLPAARLGARVVATDWAPKMIECFEARARSEGLSGFEGHVMDCHCLDFESNTFDVTGSQFGVMLVEDQPLALREMVRVTRPGGRVLVVSYGSPAEFEALQVFIGALQAVLPGFSGLPDEPPPLEFQTANPDVLKERLEDAGLRQVKVHTAHKERLELRSGQELWDWCVSGNPIPGMLVADLNSEQRTAMVQHLDRRLAERPKRRGVAVLTAPLNIGVGTK